MVAIRQSVLGSLFTLILICLKMLKKDLKHKIEFIIKNNESLAENKIKNEDWTIIVKI